jgi:hypothetical protein
VAAFLLAVGFGYLSAGPAGAEQSGGGGVVVKFNSSFSPRYLLRRRPLPVTLTLSGAIRSSEAGTHPPPLRRIEIAFGAHGELDTTGLPRCPRARLRNATARQALGRCGAALVGRGRISTEVGLDPEEPLLAQAGVLAFNGRSRGRPAVWLHAYSASPPVAFVLPFHLQRLRKSAYGLILSAPVQSALGRWPRLRSFRIVLGRRYRAGGREHSYLSARCPLPPRLSIGILPVARAIYEFSPRPTHRVTVQRGCRVRR